LLNLTPWAEAAEVHFEAAKNIQGPSQHDSLRRQALQLLAAAPALGLCDTFAQSQDPGQSPPATEPVSDAGVEFPRRALIEAPYENSLDAATFPNRSLSR